jgi:hypothetical protein
MIDSTGRAHIKPYIDAYRDDYITLDTHLRQYCLIQTYTKMTNMIREIVGYYNFIGEDYSPMYIHYNEVVNNAIQKIEEMKIRDIYNDPVRDHTRVEIGALFLGYAMFFTDSENHQFTLLKNKSLEFLHSIYSKHTPHKDNRNAFFPEQVWF